MTAPADGLEIVAGDGVSPATLHAAFGAAFADYLIGPFDLAFDAWPGFLARQAVDLAASRVALRGDTVLAFGLVAPRGESGRWRLAAMGAVPAARGSGAAPRLLDDVLARARGAGMRGVELECFAQNERAQRLYRGHGFVARHELGAWALAEGAPLASADGAAAALAVREVDRATAFEWLDDTARRVGDVPLQVTTPSLVVNARPLRFLQAGAAQLVFSDLGEGAILVHSLIDAAPAQAGAQAVIAAMRATRPGAAVSVPPIQRDDLGGAALLRLGFERQPLHQLLMLRTL